MLQISKRTVDKAESQDSFQVIIAVLKVSSLYHNSIK